jgi:hypothetical protein
MEQLVHHAQQEHTQLMVSAMFAQLVKFQPHQDPQVALPAQLDYFQPKFPHQIKLNV